MRNYYILVARSKSQHDKYVMVFGDYSKAVVEQEKRDTTIDNEYRSLKVFLVGDKEAEIVAFINELNK